MLITDPETGKTHSPRPGEIFKNPNLARTFREVAEKGKKGFYEGRIAEAIVERESRSEVRLCFDSRLMFFVRAVIQSKGGVMTLEDLKNHSTTPVTPISINYGGENGVTLHETPPNGQGLTALIALGIIEAIKEQGKVDLSKTEHLSAQWFHTLMCVFRCGRGATKADSSSPQKLGHPPRFCRHSRLRCRPRARPRARRGAPLKGTLHRAVSSAFLAHSSSRRTTFASAPSSLTRPSRRPSSTRARRSPRPTPFSSRLSTSSETAARTSSRTVRSSLPTISGLLADALDEQMPALERSPSLRDAASRCRTEAATLRSRRATRTALPCARPLHRFYSIADLLVARQPNKRPYHTIIPALVTRGNKKGGDLFMVYGVVRFRPPPRTAHLARQISDDCTLASRWAASCSRKATSKSSSTCSTTTATPSRPSTRRASASRPTSPKTPRSSETSEPRSTSRRASGPRSSMS